MTEKSTLSSPCVLSCSPSCSCEQLKVRRAGRTEGQDPVSYSHSSRQQPALGLLLNEGTPTPAPVCFPQAPPLRLPPANPTLELLRQQKYALLFDPQTYHDVKPPGRSIRLSRHLCIIPEASVLTGPCLRRNVGNAKVTSCPTLCPKAACRVGDDQSLGNPALLRLSIPGTKWGAGLTWRSVTFLL